MSGTLSRSATPGPRQTTLHTTVRTRHAAVAQRHTLYQQPHLYTGTLSRGAIPVRAANRPAHYGAQTTCSTAHAAPSAPPVHGHAARLRLPLHCPRRLQLVAPRPQAHLRAASIPASTPAPEPRAQATQRRRRAHDADAARRPGRRHTWQRAAAGGACAGAAVGQANDLAEGGQGPWQRRRRAVQFGKPEAEACTVARERSRPLWRLERADVNLQIGPGAAGGGAFANAGGAVEYV